MVAGLVTAFLIIALVEGIALSKYMAAPGFDPENPEALRAHIASLPATAFITILAAYAAASFSGAFLAVALSKIMRQGLIIALVLLMANTVNLIRIEHPLWFAISSTLVYFPFAWLGGKAAIAIQKDKSVQ